jgi:hypothetical protein
VICGGDMPCGGQVMVFACRVRGGGDGGFGGGGSHDAFLGGCVKRMKAGL